MICINLPIIVANEVRLVVWRSRIPGVGMNLWLIDRNRFIGKIIVGTIIVQVVRVHVVRKAEMVGFSDRSDPNRTENRENKQQGKCGNRHPDEIASKGRVPLEKTQ